MSEQCDTMYRRVIIIDKKKDKVLVDEDMVGPRNEEDHLREVFANTPKLKGIKGKQMMVKCIPLAEYKTMNDGA